MIKTCTKCGEAKGLEEFHAQKAGRHGKTAACKACHALKHQAYKTQHAANLQASRLKTQLRRFYHMTPEDYAYLLEKQAGCCAICETRSFGRLQRFCVDHDHSCCSTMFTCGRCIRGLICEDCNILLGRAKDDSLILERAARYLESWNYG